MANRLETMVIETDWQEKETIGLEYLLEDVQVVLGQGRSE
jgi:hypothetical protein